MNEQYEPLVARINATPYMGYYAIAGGGTRFVPEFLECGGGSATILGVNIPYNQGLFDEFVFNAHADYGTPFKYVSEEAAIALANASYEKRTTEKGFGIGVTVSLAKGGPEREGREHMIFIAGVREGKTVIQTTTLQQGRSRVDEESLVVWNIFKVTAELLDVEFGLSDHFGMEVRREGEETKTRIIPTLVGTDTWHYHDNHECEVTAQALLEKDTTAIFPGSFNPIHEGHRVIKEFVEEKLGLDVVYELSVVNVEKDEVHHTEVEKRLQEIGEHTLVTNAASFNEKIEMYYGGIFVVGVDTFERIISLKYNTMADMLKWVEKCVKFIVIPRDGKTVWDVFTDSDFKEIIEALIDKEHQKLVDEIDHPISSTEIRNEEEL
jgi:nicotinic acid mononucleotide adenylyltransferase